MNEDVKKTRSSLWLHVVGNRPQAWENCGSRGPWRRYTRSFNRKCKSA